MAMGAEIAQKDVTGFSRIPDQEWLKIEKAGLYACKLKKDIIYFDNLQEMEQHFAKERTIRNAELRRLRRNRTQKVKRNVRENGFTVGNGND